MTELNEWQWEIGGLTMGKGTDYGVVVFGGLHSLQGYRVGDQPAPQRRGVLLGLDLLEPSTIVLEVTVTGSDPADCRAKVEALAAAWHMPPDEQRNGATRPLRFRVPGQLTQRYEGRPRRFDPNLHMLKGSRARGFLEYLAADPYIFGDVEQIVSTSLANPSGGRDYDRVYPVTYVASASGIVHAVNEGTAAAPARARIHGPVIGPRLEHVGLGRTLEIDITLAGGDFLDVDMSEATVLLNGTASRGDRVVQPAGWWELAPGDNELRFAASSFDAGASCDFKWRSAWV